MFSNYLVSSCKKYRHQAVLTQAGFGLVELLISISIMVIVSGVVLVQQSAFNSAILLRSQSYEVALDIREVQLNAVSAVTSDGSTAGFRNVLGVHFDDTTGSNQQYTIFRDSNNDSYFDSGEAFGEQGIMDPRFEIRDIRGIGGDNQVSVVFERPNFDARFFIADGLGVVTEVGASSIEIDVARVECVLASCIRTVEVTATGQISVQ